MKHNIIYIILCVFLIICIVYYYNDNNIDKFDNTDKFDNNNINNNKIIHIGGMSGSGKNYLLERLKKELKEDNIIYIDSDEIWNDISIEILKNYKIKDEENIGNELNYLSNSETSNKINEIINRENNKMIIIAGHTYEIDNLIKNNKNNRKIDLYCINEDKKMVYKRLMTRNLDNFIKYKDYIKNIIDDDNINVNMKEYYIKLKIKNMAPFPCNFQEFDYVYDQYINEYKNNNYIILSQNDIFNIIINKK